MLDNFASSFIDVASGISSFNVPFGKAWACGKTAFLFSVSIEFLQLFLRLGTFQLSDICYNTLGGVLGGIIYWIGWKLKCELPKKSALNKFQV